MDKALNEASKLSRIRREYLMLLMRVLIANGLPIEPWKNLVLNLGIFAMKWDTHLVFSYADCGKMDKVKELLKVRTLDVSCSLLVMNVSACVCGARLQSCIKMKLFCDWNLPK